MCHVGVVGRRHDHGAGTTLAEPVDDLGNVCVGRLVSGAVVALEVPADPLGAEHVALEAEFALADGDLLRVVEPRRGHVALAGEEQDLDDRQAAANRILVHQAGRGDGPVIGVGAEHHQRPIGRQHGAERVPDIDQVAMRAAIPHGREELLDRPFPVVRGQG